MTITAYKAFNADFTCREHKFEVGQTYSVTGEVKACRNWFHACESPFDVWGYYPVVGSGGSLTRYAEVELGGDTYREGDKIAAAEITIKAEIHLPEFVRRAVSAVIEAVKGKGDDPSGDYAQIGSSGYYARIGSSGDYARIGSSGYYARIGSSGYSARIGSSGYYAQIGSSGYYARIGSSGDYARIGSSGDYAQIGSSGDYARIGSSGYYARIGSSGDSARIGSSGYYAQIGSSGDSARIGSSGDYARIVAEGEGAVIACAGSARVTAGAGGAICIPYHDGSRTRFAVGYVGEDGVEAGKCYVAGPDGKLVEASQ